MGERRYTEQEEALEIKSLRRIIAAYAKYAPPIPISTSPLLLCPLNESLPCPVPTQHHCRCGIATLLSTELAEAGCLQKRLARVTSVAGWRGVLEFGVDRSAL